jgi:hypothetical protein
MLSSAKTLSYFSSINKRPQSITNPLLKKLPTGLVEKCLEATAPFGKEQPQSPHQSLVYGLHKSSFIAAVTLDKIHTCDITSGLEKAMGTHDPCTRRVKTQ